MRVSGHRVRYAGVSVEYIVECLRELPASSPGTAIQHDAQTAPGLRDVVVSTDPPYYDNIGYADLSDYFYIWLRRSLRGTYPSLFRTMLVPKAEELVATPYRFDGSKERAKDFFEDGMGQACRQLHACARDDVPVTIYYAYKQSTTDADGTASTGWETMLSAIVKAGFAITGTWPMRTEMASRSVAQDTNALASSIVLVCRKRPEDAPTVMRRDFVRRLRTELRKAVDTMRNGGIAPVDLAQAAIGPGMGAYSGYAAVLDADGKAMTVRQALQAINAELDEYLGEWNGNVDPKTRFCVDLYDQHGFNDMRFGEAQVLANARNVSIAAMADDGLLTAAKGTVRLRDRDELPGQPDPKVMRGCTWMLTQVLTLEMRRNGVRGCAEIVARYGDKAQAARDLAYRLFTIADRRKWAEEAHGYNALVSEWPSIVDEAARKRAGSGAGGQGSLV